jgi:hypothetical protein
MHRASMHHVYALGPPLVWEVKQRTPMLQLELRVFEITEDCRCDSTCESSL